MALKYQLDNLEGLHESLHEHYREDNGKYFLEAEGLKPVFEIEKVQKALDSERKNSKQFKDAASIWESKFTGKNPDEILAQLERIPVLEAESQGKVDSKKLNEIVETTAKQRMAPLEHEITKLKSAITERENEIGAYKAAEKRRTIHDAVRAVAAKEGFQDQTYASPEGTLMLMAERYLTIDSVGNVVVSDDSKVLTPGLPVREALGEIKNHHPYMLKQSIGGGAGGNNGAPGTTSHNVFRTNNMTDRAKFIRENEKDPGKIEFAWKSAGLSSPMAPYVGK